MSLRERAILFFAMAAVVGALFDAVVLTPLNARAKLRAAEVTTRRTEIDGLREKLLSASQQPADAPAVRLLAELREAEKQAALLAQELAGAAPGGVACWTMPPPCPPCCNACWWASPIAAQPPDPAHARQQCRWPGAHPRPAMAGAWTRRSKAASSRSPATCSGWSWSWRAALGRYAPGQHGWQARAPPTARAWPCSSRIEAGPMTFTPVAPPGCCWCLPPPARAIDRDPTQWPAGMLPPQQPRRPRVLTLRRRRPARC